LPIAVLVVRPAMGCQARAEPHRSSRRNESIDVCMLFVVHLFAFQSLRNASAVLPILDPA
jgi:hypothetical protein